VGDQAGEEEYVCPNCNEPVKPDWKACPSCGVEFADAEEEPAPAPPKPAAPAKPAPPPPAAKPAVPAKPAPPPPAAKPAAPPKAPAAPPARAAPAPPPKPEAPPASARARPAETAELPVEPEADSKSPLKVITRRLGIVGLLGVPVAMGGVFGLVAAMNYDVWFAGAPGEVVGPNQMNAMLGTIAVAGLGVFLTVLGMIRARAQPVRPREDLLPAEAKEQPPVVSTVAPPPTRREIPEPEVEAAPEVAPEPEPLDDEEEEEEDEFALPPVPAPPVSPAPPARAEALAPPPPAPVKAPPAPAAPIATPGPPPVERDELEDLFGELESEVAKAEEDEVHYECPNCHGIVREDDASCPHCHVTFES
jgi:RNA polymerase subunit RPABC4/transcription elongation factor Spt4